MCLDYFGLWQPNILSRREQKIVVGIAVMASPLYIVGMGGTTRAGSSSERLVRCVLAEAQNQGAETKFFGGEELSRFPHFKPEDPARTDQQKDFLESVRMADGFVVGSPSYHGGISGLVKNAIDLIEDLRDDANSYFSGRAVGIVVTAAGWQGCGVTLQSIRGIVHALRGWPTPLGIAVNTVEKKIFDMDGTLIDQELITACAIQAKQILNLAAAGGKVNHAEG